MGDLHVKYLLVGGGAASFAAAVEIRRLDVQGALLLVGREISRPYQRAPLSKSFLRRQVGRSGLFTCEPDWFSKHWVQLRTGCRADHLDSARSVLTLESGESISYDRLLLATGCSPRPLNIAGQELANVYAPRTIEDYEQLLMAMGKARVEGHRHPGGRGIATVIGGGLLGVEIATGLAAGGVAVDLIVGGPYPWARFGGEGAGRFLARFLAEHGIKVHAGARAVRIDGDGRAQRVVLADSAPAGWAVECDFVVAAAGTVANKELLRGTGIVAEKAILTDERCRTNVADVWAAGDCAAVRDPIFGKHRAPDRWDGAVETGAIAGINMAGGDAALKTPASFSTDLLGLPVQAWGQAKHVVRHLMRGVASGEASDFMEIGIAADGRISQILAIGRAVDAPQLPELVRRRALVGGNEESVRDPGWPLERLLE